MSQGLLAFSVVIPLHNKLPFIRETLRSAIHQRHKAAEIIIVDDGSTDGGPEAISDLLGPDVRLIRQPNSGPGPARNRGFAESRFDWVALLDADDLWLPEHLAVLAKLAKDYPLVDGLVSSFRRITAPHEFCPSGPTGSSASRVLNYLQADVAQETVWTSAAAIRRSAFFQTGGFGDFWPGEDMDFWVRFALDHDFARTEQVTALYTVGTGGLMDTWDSRPGKDEERQPVFQTLELALSDPRYSSKRGDIRAFLDGLLEQSARQAIFRGDTLLARRYFADMSVSRSMRQLPVRILAQLPGTLAAGLARLYGRLRRQGSTP
jgi:glycosyltransferase involved in cell wall biosynthesis